MARQKGMLNLSGNIEVLAGAPFDARDIVPTKADLTVASNFPYPYVGMETYVTAEDKKYRYMGGDITDLSNWVEIGSGGGGQTYNDFTGATASTAGAHGLVPAPSAGDEGKVLFGNGSWGNIVMPSVDLSNSSVESDILDTAEKAIGTTTDGYLIYQKVVSTGGSVPSGATLLMRVQLQNSTDIIRYTKTTDSPLPSGVKFAGVTASGEVILKKEFTKTVTCTSSDNIEFDISNLNVSRVYDLSVMTQYVQTGDWEKEKTAYTSNGNQKIVTKQEWSNNPQSIRFDSTLLYVPSSS